MVQGLFCAGSPTVIKAEAKMEANGYRRVCVGGLQTCSVSCYATHIHHDFLRAAGNTIFTVSCCNTGVVHHHHQQIVIIMLLPTTIKTIRTIPAAAPTANTRRPTLPRASAQSSDAGIPCAYGFANAPLCCLPLIINPMSPTNNPLKHSATA